MPAPDYLENILGSLRISRNSHQVQPVPTIAHKSTQTNSHGQDGEPHHEAAEVPHQQDPEEGEDTSTLEF